MIYHAVGDEEGKPISTTTYRQFDGAYGMAKRINKQHGKPVTVIKVTTQINCIVNMKE